MTNSLTESYEVAGYKKLMVCMDMKFINRDLEIKNIVHHGTLENRGLYRIGKQELETGKVSFYAEPMPLVSAVYDCMYRLPGYVREGASISRHGCEWLVSRPHGESFIMWIEPFSN